MTQLLIDRATLEQLVEALQRVNIVDSDCDILNPSLSEAVADAIEAGRAALANVEPAGWQTLVDHGKEAHELAKIMKDFADKNPESLMLKELDN